MTLAMDRGTDSAGSNLDQHAQGGVFEGLAHFGSKWPDRLAQTLRL